MADTICIDTSSPTYSTLPRLNTTALLLFVLLAPFDLWASKGALAALMARVATISIHAIVLLATKSDTQPFALDIIGSWFILSEVAVAVSLLLSWAKSLRTSKARFLVRTWGILVAVGAICAFVTLKWAIKNAHLATCPGSSIAAGSISIVRDQIFSRLNSDTLLGEFDLMAIILNGFGVWICLRSDNWDPGSFLRSALAFVEIAFLFLAVVVLVTTIVLHEMYLLGKPHIPMLEDVTSFEQWSCWAATGLVVSATVANWLFNKDPPKLTTYTSEHSEGEHSIPDLEWAGGSAKSYLGWNGKGKRSDLESTGVLASPPPTYIS